MFNYFNIRISYRGFHLLTLITAFIAVVPILIGLHLYYQFVEKKPFELQITETMVYQGCYIIRHTPVYFFFTLMMIITIKIRHLNSQILHLSQIKISQNMLLEKLRIITDIHLKLCKSADNLNSSFGFSMLGNLVGSSVLLILAVLTFCGVNADRQGEIILWTSGNIPITWSILIFCNIAMYEVIINKLNIIN